MRRQAYRVRWCSRHALQRVVDAEQPTEGSWFDKYGGDRWHKAKVFPAIAHTKDKTWPCFLITWPNWYSYIHPAYLFIPEIDPAPRLMGPGPWEKDFDELGVLGIERRDIPYWLTARGVGGVVGVKGMHKLEKRFKRLRNTHHIYAVMNFGFFLWRFFTSEDLQ